MPGWSDQARDAARGLHFQSLSISRLPTSGRVLDAAPASTSGRLLGGQFGARGHRRHLGAAEKCRKQHLASCAVAEGRVSAWLELPADNSSVNESPDGLVTNRRVSKGQTVLSVPASLWMTRETVTESVIGPYVKDLQPWLQVALFILHEKAKPRSEWQAYLEDLSEDLDTPLLWPDSELENLLGGTQFLNSIFGYREYFSSKLQELQETIFSKSPDIFSDAIFSADKFTWAAAVLRAKVHAPLEGDSFALVPLADKVAHQRGPGVAWKVSMGGFGRKGKALVLEAQKDIGAGETVTMDFGPEKLDAEILLNYGQMDDFVTRAGFTLSLELPEDDRFFDDKADILAINGLTEAQDFVLSSEEEPTEDMLAYLRLVNLSGGCRTSDVKGSMCLVALGDIDHFTARQYSLPDVSSDTAGVAIFGADAFLLESLFRNDAWGHLRKPMSLDNETAVFTSMIEGCREALTGYRTSVPEDKAALRSAEAGSRLEKALRVRIGEKEALAATLQFFEERISRLSKLEFYQERRLKGLGLLDEDGRSTFDDFFKDGIA